MAVYRRSEEGLGAEQVVFRKPAGRTVAELVLGAILSLLGVAGAGLVVVFVSSMTTKVALGCVSLVFAALGVSLFVGAVADRRTWLAFHERGCRYRRGGELSTLLFADVTSLRSEHVIERTVTTDSTRWWSDRHTVTLRDGTSVELLCPFVENVQVLARLHAGTAHLVDAARRALSEGGTLERGAITVSTSGVHVAGRTIPFRTIATVESAVDRDSDAASADLELHLTDGTLARVPLADVVDAHAVEAVVRDAIGGTP